MSEEKNAPQIIFDSVNHSDAKFLVSQENKSDAYLYLIDYFKQVSLFKCTYEFLSIWNILKYHTKLPKSNRGVFRSVCINISKKMEEALVYLTEKKTVKSEVVKFQTERDDSLPLDYDHQIRKIHLDLTLKLGNNKIDIAIARTSELKDVFSFVSILHGIRDFSQTNVLVIPVDLVVQAVCFLNLLYREIYPVIFPWSDQVFVCFRNKKITKTKLIDVCESARNSGLLYCGKDILVLGSELVEEMQKKCKTISDIYCTEEFLAQWHEEF